MILIDSTIWQDNYTGYVMGQYLKFMYEEKDKGRTGECISIPLVKLFGKELSMSICELCIMDTTGDTRITWFPDSDEEIKAAKKEFDSLKKKGWSFFTTEGLSGKGKKIKYFDSTLSQIIAVPPIAGG